MQRCYHRWCITWWHGQWWPSWGDLSTSNQFMVCERSAIHAAWSGTATAARVQTMWKWSQCRRCEDRGADTMHRNCKQQCDSTRIEWDRRWWSKYAQWHRSGWCWWYGKFTFCVFVFCLSFTDAWCVYGMDGMGMKTDKISKNNNEQFIVFT